MPKYQDIADFFEKVSLAQKIAYKNPEFTLYVGSDVEIGKTLATLKVLHDQKKLDDTTFTLIATLLHEQNKATFANSEKTDIYTKLGLMKPQREMVLDLGSTED